MIIITKEKSVADFRQNKQSQLTSQESVFGESRTGVTGSPDRLELREGERNPLSRKTDPESEELPSLS